MHLRPARAVRAGHNQHPSLDHCEIGCVCFTACEFLMGDGGIFAGVIWRNVDVLAKAL
jgi:hypothetical protein